MLFSSITFLYFFLPMTFLLYGIASCTHKSTWKNAILCIMSCFFYAWGEPMYVFLMLALIGMVYGFTIGMDKKRETVLGKVFFVLSVFIPFAFLFYFKYAGFVFADLIPLDRWKKIALPIGISFYTFQLTSYSIDVWCRKVKVQKNLLSLATYITMFPQLIAGPIVRYCDVERELTNREITKVDWSDGIVRFVIGLGKKVLIANVLGEFIAEVMALQTRSIGISWAYAMAVSLQIYFDFSGYSDMAIGLGRMLGFHFPENFYYPFMAESITEFWRRWHMTLGSWFRDYVYIPMGGNRVKTARWFVNLLVVWFLTGLWHGAGWNFILWGLYFGVLLILEKRFWKKERHNVFSHIYVILAVMISFLIFHAENLQMAWNDMKALLPGMIIEKTQLETAHYILRNRIGILFIAIIGATPIPAYMWKGFIRKISNAVIKEFCVTVGVLIIVIVSTAYLVDGSFNPFLYFRF